MGREVPRGYFMRLNSKRAENSGHPQGGGVASPSGDMGPGSPTPAVTIHYRRVDSRGTFPFHHISIFQQQNTPEEIDELIPASNSSIFVSSNAGSNLWPLLPLHAGTPKQRAMETQRFSLCCPSSTTHENQRVSNASALPAVAPSRTCPAPRAQGGEQPILHTSQ